MAFIKLYTHHPIKIFLIIKLLFLTMILNAQGNHSLQIMDTVTVYSDTITYETGSDTQVEEDENGTVEVEKADREFFLRKELFNSDHDSFQLRSVPDSIIKKMQDDDAFWYASQDFRKKSKPNKTTFFEQLVDRSWFRTLIWVLIIGGFISVLAWYLVSSNVSIFRRRPGEIKQGDPDELSENIFEINFEKEISKAISEGEYRIAVRLMFLDVLKNLSQRDLISYQNGKTNLDYLLQLQPTRYYKEFFRLTRDYEYTWYGKFDLSADTFSIIKNDFESFRNRIQ